MTTATRTTGARGDGRPASRRTRIVVVIAAAAAILLAVGALALATPITDALHRQHRESFATRAEAKAGWVGVPMPAWVPADATNLRSLATTDETNAVIRVDSAATEPLGCIEADRRTLPALTADWVPNPAPMPDRVWACGPYEVTRVGGSLLGWFQADRRGATPETQSTP